MRNPYQAPPGADRETTGFGAERAEPALRQVAPDAGALVPLPDDLSRDVHCVLGMPIDAIGMATALHRIRAAARGDVPFLVSTANLNFLTSSLQSGVFRDSLIESDLCTADGSPILWLARLLGIPMTERVAGSDMFENLATSPAAEPLPVFFFGGSDGAADAACRSASGRKGVKGAGAVNPGYGTIDELSHDRFIDVINASKARFLVVALGAAKGQAWLLRNHHRLRVPVRAHLGATVNFAAGDVRRAPPLLRRTGLEWLWRIKEEPHLWGRYWADGRTLLRLVATRALPLALRLAWHRLRCGDNCTFKVGTLQRGHSVVLRLTGHATARHIARAIVHFRNGINLSRERMVVDLSGLDFIDTRFFGLLLMVTKQLKARGTELELVGASPGIRKLFSLNELGYLIAAGRGK